MVAEKTEEVKDRLHTMMLTMVVVTLAMTASCSRKVTEAVTSTTSQSDSVVYVETLRVDTFRLAGETITRTIELECDEQGQVMPVADVDREGRASVAVSTKGNTLTVTANCDSLEQLLVSKDTRLSRMSELRDKLSHIKDTRINCTAKWYHKGAMWISAFYLTLTLLWVLWKVFRGYLKAQIPFLP